MNNNSLRSPFFYVGDKYKLMPQINKLKPDNIATYYEPFVGGGSSFLNSQAKKIMVNDIDNNLISLHEHLYSFKNKENELFNLLFKIVEHYDLTCSLKGRSVPKEYLELYKKTYFAHYNREAYIKLREDFNKGKDKDLNKLYLLLIYGFNRMLRFNKKGEFNIPVGNVDFNKNVATALSNYLEFSRNNNISFYNKDYLDFLRLFDYNKNDFIYFDPPYLISNSEYNKFWNEENEITLYRVIDKLDKCGVKFGLSNLLLHKGQHNIILEEWMKKYNVFDVKSNYISRFDNSFKNSQEVYVTNYEKE